MGNTKIYPQLKGTQASLWVWATYRFSVSNVGYIQFFLVHLQSPHLHCERNYLKPLGPMSWPNYLFHMPYPAPEQRTEVDFWR